VDTSHFGKTPTELASAILTGLSALQLDAGSGCVRTIGRLRSTDAEALAAALHPGVPAILLYYSGGTSKMASTHGQIETDDLVFELFCVSGSLSAAPVNRQDTSQRNADLAVLPGVEQLQDWTRYFGLRALSAAGGCCCRTVRFGQAHRIDPEHWIASVTLACEREVDIYDDATANYLLSLGICHDPTEGYDDPDLWFTGAPPETPVSDWQPPGVDGGVTDL
jgi:hypothetical protein